MSAVAAGKQPKAGDALGAWAEGLAGRRKENLGRGYCANGSSPREAWELLRALEDERLARAPRTASTLPPQPPERRRATTGLTGIGVVIFLLLIFGALPLYFTVTGLGHSIRAARGEGTAGYFIPQRETAGRGAFWYGEFRLPSGTVTARNASIEDDPATAMHAGVPVAARDPGSSEASFPPGTQAVMAAWRYAWALVIIGQWIRKRCRRRHGIFRPAGSGTQVGVLGCAHSIDPPDQQPNRTTGAHRQHPCD